MGRERKSIHLDRNAYIRRILVCVDSGSTEMLESLFDACEQYGLTRAEVTLLVEAAIERNHALSNELLTPPSSYEYPYALPNGVFFVTRPLYTPDD